MKVIAVTCNRYNDAAPAWLYCQRSNWADCPYPVEILANSDRLSVDAPVHYIKGEERAYGWRMRQFIEQHYQDDLILISMIDYLIKSSNQTAIAEAEAWCQMDNIVHVRLRPMPPPELPFDVDGFGEIDKSTRYTLSLQPGIWRTEVLYNLLRDDEDPWQTEIQGSIRAGRRRGVFLSTTEHVLPHLNYYAKGKVTLKTIQWVKDNVPAEFWPRAVREPS